MVDNDDRAERWGGKTWTLIAALTVILIIAATAGILALRSDDPSHPTVTVEGLPDSFVGGRQIAGGVPVGFEHSEQGAISAAATWVAAGYVYPAVYRPQGIAAVFQAGAMTIDPDGPVDTGRIIAVTPWAVRGTIGDDAGVVEIFALSAGDFLLPTVDTGLDALATSAEIMAVSMVWEPGVGDWRITAVERRPLDPAQLTSQTLAGFRWLRPIG